MMPRLRSTVAAVAVVVGATVACHDSTGPKSNALTLDQALAELSNPALASTGPPFVDIGDFTPSLTSAACPYSAESQKFVCTPVTKRGITLEHNFTLVTAFGLRQTTFDPASTDSLRVNTDVDGTLVDGETNVRVYGQQQVTLHGLVSGPHVLDGYASIVVAGTVAVGASTYPLNVRVTTSIYHLVLPADAAAGSSLVWPSFGRITVGVSAPPGATAPAFLQTETIIQFVNGTSTVDVTVIPAGGVAGAVGCKVNLAVARPVCL